MKIEQNGSFLVYLLFRFCGGKKNNPPFIFSQTAIINALTDAKTITHTNTKLKSREEFLQNFFP